MTFFIFIISFFLVIGLTSTYVAWRLISPAGFRKPVKVSIGACIILALLVAPLRVLLQRLGIETNRLDLFVWIGYIYLGMLSFLFILMIGRDLLWGGHALVRLIKRMGRSPKHSAGIPAQPDPDRRRFILNAVNTGIVLSGTAMTGVGYAQATRIPDIKHVPIPVRGLHPDLEGFRIVQITDIHVSVTLKRPFVEGVAQKVNQLSPDIVVLTGDLVDGTVPRLKKDVAPLAHLQSRYGRFFVTGNHEYYSGVKPWIEHVTGLGFRVLLNQNQLIQHQSGRLLVAGVTDYRAGRFLKSHISDPFKAMRNAPAAHLKILLAHQPKSIFKAARAGFDLQISGHTHGGQFFPWNFFVGLIQPYTAGLHTYENTQIYISRGTGYWGPPIRLGASSEITLLTLQRV